MLTAQRLSHHLTQLRDAEAHLSASLGQAIPSDDPIIVEHIAAASHILRGMIREMAAHRDRLQLAAASPAGRTAA